MRGAIIPNRPPRESGLPGDVGDGVVQLDVHLVKSLLHPQQMLAGRTHQAIAMAHQRAHRADRRRRAERGVEQPDDYYC